MKFLLRNVAKKWEPSKWTMKPIVVQAFCLHYLDKPSSGPRTTKRRPGWERTALECHGRGCIPISSSLMLDSKLTLFRLRCELTPGPAVTLLFSAQEAPASGHWS